MIVGSVIGGVIRPPVRGLSPGKGVGANVLRDDLNDNSVFTDDLGDGSLLIDDLAA